MKLLSKSLLITLLLCAFNAQSQFYKKNEFSFGANGYFAESEKSVLNESQSTFTSTGLNLNYSRKVLPFLSFGLVGSSTFINVENTFSRTSIKTASDTLINIFDNTVPLQTQYSILQGIDYSIIRNFVGINAQLNFFPYSSFQFFVGARTGVVFQSISSLTDFNSYSSVFITTDAGPSYYHNNISNIISRENYSNNILQARSIESIKSIYAGFEFKTGKRTKLKPSFQFNVLQNSNQNHQIRDLIINDNRAQIIHINSKSVYQFNANIDFVIQF